MKKKLPHKHKYRNKDTKGEITEVGFNISEHLWKWAASSFFSKDGDEMIHPSVSLIR